MNSIKVGIVGLGRLGKTHAKHLRYQIPGAELTAACSIVPAELEYAKTELQVADVYTDYREMLKNADIDAVAIVTPSGEHCWQIAEALAAGKHVFSEKPLGLSLEQCKEAQQAVEAHPDSVFFLGFMRRYDPSYAYAMEKVKAGAIGTPYLVKATGIDPEKNFAGFMRFAATSGGIFNDMAAHDIDLMRWYLGSEVTEVYAFGSNFKHPELAEIDDVETGYAMYRFANGGAGIVHVGRTAPHGYHVETEIVGTTGSIRISAVPEKNLAVLYNGNGVVTECIEDFPRRFAEAYRLEMEEFIRCIREGRKPGVSVYDGVRAAEVSLATTSAWHSGQPVKL